MSYINKLKRNFHPVDQSPNSFVRRRNKIEEFIVVHPLFQKIVQTKINKCFQHGHIRNYTTSTDRPNRNFSAKIIQAPIIDGDKKVLGKRPATSRVTVTAQKVNFRPKSTNTVIRSRTTQPRIRKKLEMLAKQEMDEESLKPSYMINKIRTKKIQSDFN